MSTALRRFDIFPKFSTEFEKDARDKTIFGAALSILALVFVVVLFVGEVNYFLSVETKHELYVDTDVSSLIPVTINVTFPNIPCDLISVDAVDTFGDFQEHLEEHSYKHRLDAHGNRIEKADDLVNTKKHEEHPEKESVAHDGTKVKCGSCYGAEGFEGQCCNTCQQVRDAYQSKGWSFHLNDVSIIQCALDRLEQVKRLQRHEGCNLWAEMRVKRVQGNIHFIPGKTFTHLGQHLHDIMGEDVQKMDLSHKIHELQFGKEYPGLTNPLDNTEKTNGQGGGKFQYFIKVVPTRYDKLAGHDDATLETNQYSVTEHFTALKPSEQGFLPGLFFVYDLSPIKVHIYQQRPYGSVIHLLLQLCAIGGGVFTVMGLVDSLFYHSIIKVRRKMQMGKQS